MFGGCAHGGVLLRLFAQVYNKIDLADKDVGNLDT